MPTKVNGFAILNPAFSIDVAKSENFNTVSSSTSKIFNKASNTAVANFSPIASAPPPSLINDLKVSLS